MDKVYSPYLVLINTECCNQTVQRFFECLLSGKYVRVDSGINKLLKELINDFEASNLKQGSRTPHFYGLSKIHKEYISFPPLRPICRGFNSCTAKISEFIDAYLKPLAQNTSSYIKDASDFVERIESDVAPTTISSKTVLKLFSLYIYIYKYNNIYSVKKKVFSE